MFRRLCLLFLLVFVTGKISAQFDTAYAVKYPDRLGISLFQSNPSFVIDISQKMNPDSQAVSNVHYTTLAKSINGVGFFYDKISLFVGFKSPLNKEEKFKKGRTTTTQIGLAITGVKLRIEAAVKSYRGLYDAYSPNYIPDFGDSTPYFQNPDLRNHFFKVKAFYFLNKKKRFSYGAAYVNNVRQIKSAGSFIISSNLYSSHIYAPKIVPSPLDTFYSPWQNWNSFRVTAISCGIGYTHTFTIFKRGFINLLATLGMEERHIVQSTGAGDPTYDSWEMSVNSYDFRSSIGFNSKYFFISIQSIVDGTVYSTPSMEIKSGALSGFLNIGYRFRVKTPGFYKAFQKTRVYGWI